MSFSTSKAGRGESPKHLELVAVPSPFCANRVHLFRQLCVNPQKMNWCLKKTNECPGDVALDTLPGNMAASYEGP